MAEILLQENPLARLSKSEIRVLQLIAIGKQTEEVADFLFVGIRAVQFNLASIYRKNREAGINNRVKAVVAYQCDLKCEPYEGKQIPQLNKRQLEILGLLATGLSNKEIAKALAYDKMTVDNCLYVIYRRLNIDQDVKNKRIHTLRIATSMGLVPPLSKFSQS